MSGNRKAKQDVVLSLTAHCARVDSEMYHLSRQSCLNYDTCRNVIRGTPIGQLPVDQITESDIAQFVQSRLADGRAPSYVNSLLVYLSTRLTTAHKRGLTPRLLDIKLLRVQRKDVDPFTKEELRRIFNAAAWIKRPAWMAPYVKLLAFTGMRPCEAVALLPKDVTVLKVRVNKKLSRLEREEPVKTRHGVRDIPLADGLFLVLLPLCDNPQYGRIFPMMAYRAEHWWRPLLKDAEVPFRSIYHLRHTFATRALELGASMVQVAGWLGHSSIHHVADVYSQWSKTSDSPIFSKMGVE